MSIFSIFLEIIKTTASLYLFCKVHNYFSDMRLKKRAGWVIFKTNVIGHTPCVNLEIAFAYYHWNSNISCSFPCREPKVVMNNFSFVPPVEEKQIPYEILAVVLSILSIGTIIGNIFVLIAIRTQTSLQRPTYIPIGSLALADLLAGLFAMPAYLIKKSPVVLSAAWEGVVCDIFRFSYFTSGYGSIISLAVISAERMVAVRFSLKYHTIVSGRRLGIALLVAWFDVMVMSLIPFLPLEGGSGDVCHYRPTSWWSMMVIVKNVFIPFLFILICYIDMYIAVRRVLRKIEIQTNTKQNVQHHHRDTKGTKTVTIVIGLFILSWFPSCLYYFLREICPTCFPETFEAQGIFNSLMKLLTFAGSFWNPLIYCWRSLEFRRAFLRILTRKSIIRTSDQTNVPTFSLGVNMHWRIVKSR